jgi:hypothetical protein
MKDWNEHLKSNEDLDYNNDLNKIVNYLARLEHELLKNGIDFDFSINDHFGNDDRIIKNDDILV